MQDRICGIDENLLRRIAGPYVTSRLPERVSATAGVPEIAADLLPRPCRQPWTKCGLMRSEKRPTIPRADLLDQLASPFSNRR
jgi:hypothetical protein